MSQSLYHELKKIGIDEELAGKVSASLDPEYNATKKDILVMHDCMDAGDRAMQEQLPKKQLCRFSFVMMLVTMN